MTQQLVYALAVNGIFFLLSVVFSYLINRLFLRFVKTLGIRNSNDTVIRWDSQSKPAVGGFSFYILFLLSIIGYSVTFDTNQVFLNIEYIGILLATMLGFLLGLADDAYNTRPLFKFVTQVSCGIILLASGTEITLSNFEPINYIITIVWVVGIMNSLNMLDNMDAITTTVSISIILACLTMMFFRAEVNSIYFIMQIGVMAALIGFLYFNWNPSSMYMGDTGSQFLGVFLAAMGIKFLWNATPPSGDLISAKNLILPMLVFILPIIDTTTVTINRLLRGKSPFVGGKDHTTHALAYLGLNDRQVAVVFGIISLISLFLVFLISQYLDAWNHLYTFLFIGYFLVMFSLLFYASRTAKA